MTYPVNMTSNKLKFQWAKASAMFGDYKEFISAWGKAVDATGFTTEQIKMQMDTIARKIETLKADMEGLVVSGGNNTGFTQFLKTRLDALDNLVVMLKKVPEEAYTATMYLGGIATAIYVVKRATDALAISVTAMNKTWIGLALSAVALGAGTIIDHYGQMENASRRATLAMQDDIAVENQKIESMKQQSQFADALFSSYQKLDEQVSNSAEGTDKHTKALENRQATENELTNILGEAAVERIRQSGWTQDAYNSEKQVFSSGTDEKKQKIAEYADARKKELLLEKSVIEDKLKLYKRDAEAFAEAAKAKLGIMGMVQIGLNELQAISDDVMAGTYEQVAEGYDKQLSRMSKDDADYYKVYDEKLRAENEARGYASNAQGKRAENDSKINGVYTDLNQRISEIDNEIAKVGAIEFDFHPSGAGGSDAPEKTDSKKGSGGNSTVPASAKAKLEKNEWKMRKDDDFTNAKLSADRYEQSLSNLSLTESIYGQTVSSNTNKQKLMQSRITELTKESETYKTAMGELDGKISELINSDSDWLDAMNITQEQWSGMSKDARRAFVLQRRDILETSDSLKNYTSVLNDYSEKCSDAQKKVNELRNEMIKMNFDGVLDNGKIHDRKMKEIDFISKSAENSLEGYTGTDYNQRKYEIRYNTALAKLQEVKRYREQLESELKQAQDDAYASVAGLTEQIQGKQKELESLTDDSEKYMEVQRKLKELNDTRAIAERGESKAVYDKAQAVRDASLAEQDYKVELDKTKDKYQDVRSSAADMFSSLVVEGHSAKDELKKIWQDIAKDAIRRLFQIQDAAKQTNWFMQLLGVGTGAGTSTGAWQAMGGYTSVTGFFNHKGGEIKENPKMHSGGRVMLEPTLRDDEVNRTLQVGERVLSRKDNQRYEQVLPELVRYAATVPKGTQVEPVLSNPRLMQPDTFKSAEVKINSAMTAQLERQNMLMEQQNSMLASMGEGKGNVVVLNTQADSASVMKALQENPRALQAILGGQRKMGFR